MFLAEFRELNLERGTVIEVEYLPGPDQLQLPQSEVFYFVVIIEGPGIEVIGVTQDKNLASRGYYTKLIALKNINKCERKTLSL